jgi:pyruvate,orthophosphate dikinase
MAAPSSEPATRGIVRLVGQADADREIVGGKGWSINRMAALGLPVPPAFAIPTEHCRRFLAAGGALPDELLREVDAGLAWLGEVTGRPFGVGPEPLLVSVRSGAARSMPGMLDTVLNVGLTADPPIGDQRFAADLRRRFDSQYRTVVGAPPPADPVAQLRGAVAAVFGSWESPRARAYRRERGLDETAGTAVVVQAMVFGNRDARSGTGVVFSRDPVTGEPSVFGEWLPGGQGEDVVSGRTTPLPLAALESALPATHAELVAAARRLEADAGTAQDIEFTVESGRLWLLQTRAATLASAASTSAAGGRVLLTGRPASPGRATGTVVLDPDEAARRADGGEDVVLARSTTSPQDLPGMLAARAVVTELGGATCHAAVVSRELGRPCVVGCGPGSVTALAGQIVTVDGTRGEILTG